MYIRTLVITYKTGERYGFRFDESANDSDALHNVLSLIDPGTDYTIRFTNSNRNLRGIEWLNDDDSVNERTRWDY